MSDDVQFPLPTTYEPTATHTHTVIILHGRGDTAQEFAHEFFSSSSLSTTNPSLCVRFPSFRWVFPCSRELWSPTFQELLPAWFEAPSLTDVLARPDRQIPGIKESVTYIRAVVDDEVGRLGNEPRNVFVGGISQGAAVGLWVVLAEPSVLGGFFGASCWLPFYKDVIEYVDRKQEREVLGRLSHGDKIQDAEDAQIGQKFVESMMDLRYSGNAAEAKFSPIFLGHGVDDAFVDIDLGRSARDVLLKAGHAVEWKEYRGADQEGHWFKDPEEIDDIASFLAQVSHH